MIYWPNLTDFFALDDYIWLQAASNPNAADFFRRAFSFPARTLFDAPTPFWRPLVDAYFFVGWRTFGLDPLPYHVTNVVLHGVIAALIAILVWQLTSSRVTSLLAGILFVVLPTYGIAVTWISSVTELLGALFYLLTLVLYAAYLRGPPLARWLYIGALVALVLALLSKESSVTIPIALAGLTVATRPPRNWRALLRRTQELVPFAALTLAYFIFLYVQEYGSTSGGGLYQFGWHAWGNLWDYLQWITLPLPDDWASWVGAARPFTAIAFLILGTYAVAFRKPLLGLTFAWTIVALLPYSFFPAGIEYRYTYLASVPFVIFISILVSAGFPRIALRFGAYPATALVVAVLLSLSAFLAVQARDRQTWLSDQAQAYGDLFDQAPMLCGDLPQESHIYLLYSPIFDLFGRSVRMALNLVYDDVFYHRPRGGRLPELAAFIENKCVLDYREGRYTLVTSD